MTVQNKTVIKSYFEAGDKPTQSEFVDFIDSYQDFSTALTQLANSVIATATGLSVQTNGKGGFQLISGGAGDVTGPASSTQYGIATFKDTTGKVIENSPVTITSAGNASGFVNINATGKITTSSLAVTTLSAQSISVNGDVSVSGDASFKDITGQRITGSVASFTGNLTVNGKTTTSGISSTAIVSAENGLDVSGAARFKAKVSAENGLQVSGLADFRGNVNVSGNAYVSGSFTGGGVAYRVFTAVTTCSMGDFGKVLVCQASATTTVALRDGTEALPQGYNVRIRMRRSGMVQVIIPAADKIVGGTAYQVTAQNKEALFEVESVSGSEHTWWSAGTN